jgi:hypothetical protein
MKYEEKMNQGNAMKHNQGSMKKMGEMGNANKPEMIQSIAPSEMGKIKEMKRGDMGYSKKAWDYKY